LGLGSSHGLRFLAIAQDKYREKNSNTIFFFLRIIAEFFGKSFDAGFGFCYFWQRQSVVNCSVFSVRFLVFSF
jgi:hypothetical protein